MESSQHKNSNIPKMMEFIPHNVNIDFVKKFPLTGILSLIMVIGSILLVAIKGLNYGVDFSGGAEVQVKFSQSVDLASVRKVLAEEGFDSASVQSIGDPSANEYLIKVSADEKNLNAVTNTISEGFKKSFQSQGVEIRKTDIVGPKAGAELRMSGLKALFYAVLIISIYIGLRFDFKYSPGAICSLLHDTIITIGVFSLVGKEFSLQIVAALLTVIGYSVNDTVVVYDRIREHEGNFTQSALKNLINSALNETLSRTFLTSGTVFFVALAMYFWGGESIQDFFFSMIVGTILGTYSTLFIAAPLTIFFDKLQKGKVSQTPASLT